MKIVIDPGHGGISDTGAVGLSGTKEKDINLTVATKLAELLTSEGISVKMTRTSDIDVSLAVRATTANSINADYFISVHCNAFVAPTASGTETHHYYGSAKGKQLAESVQTELVSALGLTNRGVKESDFYVLRATAMPAVLIELAFLSNPDEEKLLNSPDFQNKCANAIFKGITKTIGTLILHEPRATIAQAKEWARAKGATNVFINLADLYWEIAPLVDVDPVVAYCQAAKETRYGKFGGTIDESYCNPCGLKISEGGGNYDPSAHQRFDSWNDGVAAHIDHLALYAGKKGYPKQSTLDPRHFSNLLGTAETVEQLGNKWAPSSTYGIDIVRMMEELIATSEPIPNNVSSWAQEAWSWATKNGITDGTRPKDIATREEIVTMLYRFKEVIK